jgi:hypothetical protein
MNDPTEALRREMIEMNYPQAVSEKAQQRWDTQELQRDFVVHGFLAPFVLVTRKSDNVRGALMFTHSPRSYFDFKPD